MSSERRKQFPFDEFEPKWQKLWDDTKAFRTPGPGDTDFDASKPKYYVLDMFPYPSGQGLHVGHPEGYTATDIVARYKKLCGFNVLHPMGWDAFGLPAEQYAIKTGQHPRKTTEANIDGFRAQLKRLGFAYDWDREVNTTDPGYFKWTQWIFLQLYNSYFDPVLQKARPIVILETALAGVHREVEPEIEYGTPDGVKALNEEVEHDFFLNNVLEEYGDDTMGIEEDEAACAIVRAQIIDRLRLAYVSEAPVNWCPELGTVLANEEVIDGKSEVGGFPVERRPMRQWMLRITAYCQRLIDELDGLDWPEGIKLLQKNWIGKSEGAEVHFKVADLDETITVFTTRPDTLFGATYMVLAPEHRLVDAITSEEQLAEVEFYRERTTRKSDLERTELAKEKSGVFTGAYAINPVNNERIPIWIADYVLTGYGTGAIMAVPAHDERDFEFATKFNLPIREVVSQQLGMKTEASPVCEMPFAACFAGEGYAVNSAFLNGLPTAEAKAKITTWLAEKGLGAKTTNFKLRDWLFSRQRYWGEPFPILWEDGHHRALPESELPLVPPDLVDFKPTGTPEPPLSKAKSWVQYSDKATRELNTMPQWAGSCWYYLRYCDPKNSERFISKEADSYWMGGCRASAPLAQTSEATAGGAPALQQQKNAGGVDLYVGGTEHAVLHLLYARFWHKVLFDLGHVTTPEPFQRLVNQGLILGEDGQKMSKSRGNVVNPDEVVLEYGADSLRLYEMFMGPLEQVKPWQMKGVEGVYRFLARVWRLVMESNQEGEWMLSSQLQDVSADKKLNKITHETIKKVSEDIEKLSFNTAISQMMVLTNALTQTEVRPAATVMTLLQILNPFAPHITEELSARVGAAFPKLKKNGLLAHQTWPAFDPAALVENEFEVIIQVNGKLRDRLTVAKDISKEALEALAMQNAKVAEFTAGLTVRKVIVVPGKLVNVVAS